MSVLAVVGLLAMAAAGVAGLTSVDRLLSDWSRSDVQQRARAIADTLGSPGPASGVPSLTSSALRSDLERLGARNRRFGLAVCRSDGATLVHVGLIPAGLDCTATARLRDGQSRLMRAAGGPLEVSVFVPRALQPGAAGHEPYRLELVEPLGFLAGRQSEVRTALIALSAGMTLTMSLAVGLLAWLLLRRWSVRVAAEIRSGRLLEAGQPSRRLALPLLQPIRSALGELQRQRRIELDYRENWTPLALQQLVRDQLRSAQIIVVSNREPYAHEYDGEGRIEVRVPASGMVTALEPVVRACSGIWVAHGAGTADRAAVDASDGVRVPPEAPAYRLRRVWLSEAEEQGYYYGLSNEGLWPLCHLAYVRPAFRASDWAVYEQVNRKFCEVIGQEASSGDPVILIQDYHFALLPGQLRAARPGATIALFWHIPWPNPETFGVCPWKQEMLSHLLAADILGFHTLQHCRNFLATVDRFIECQIDREHMTVTLRGHVCHVRAYPISIEWPPRWLSKVPAIDRCRAAVRSRFGIGESVRLGLGVERWDFTKGLIERFLAFELLLEGQPELLGQVTLLQIASPSRSKLPAYQALQQSTLCEVERINNRFAEGAWRPIMLIAQHQTPEQVFELYRAADFCIVNSLHDGMNLVAKEFVAARDDEDGVLILSRFAGASRELTEALLINPFDVSETAAAMAQALELPIEQRRARMQLMRRTVQDNNVYRWAGRMLLDCARVRQRQSIDLQAALNAAPAPTGDRAAVGQD